MKSAATLALLGLAGRGLAFPFLAPENFEQTREQLEKHMAKRQLPGLPGGFTAPSLVAPGFDAEAQLIDVSGEHAFVAPGAGDQRGVCPGLNALANHGYLPHNGVATIQQYIEATNTVYGMGLDLSTFLAIYGAVFDGDLTSWSMGGEASTALPLGLLTQPRGLDGSHNKYESDASPTRGDLYLYGNAFDARLDQWTQMYALQDGVDDDAADYNLEVLTPFRNNRNLDSRARNPYFFSAPFAGVAVQPAAYTFIWRFMANHSAEYPEGRLSKSVLKSFFAFTGEEGSFQYSVGHERIPENWYRRAIGDEYTIPFFIEDVILAAKGYPIFLQIGGNTGTTNSFAGVDPTDFTKGAYELSTLTEGNNLFCYAVQIAVQQAPDILFSLVSDVSSAVSQFNTAAGNALSGLGCPQLTGINTGDLSQYPGATKLKTDGTY